MALTVLAPLQGWASSLDEVPDAVFAERMMGDGIAIDPTGDCLHAPCAGRILSVQPSGHAVTLVSDEGAELLIHIGLDTVSLGGRGFTPVVRAGDRVAVGDPLIRFDLDLLVREARAVVTPIVLINGEQFEVVERAQPGVVALGAPLFTLVGRAASAATELDGAWIERTLTIPLSHGIHARPAARIADLARGFAADLAVVRGDARAPATSPTGLLTLGVAFGDTVTLAARGSDAEAALDALHDLIAGGMGETGTPAPTPPPAAPPVAAPVEVPAGALSGVTAAPGLAIGPARRHRVAELTVPEHGCGIAQEDAAFTAALDALRGDLAVRADVGADAQRTIAAAHRAMLDDPALLAATRAGIARGESAGYAWRGAIRPQAAALRDARDRRLSERADDLVDLERQVIARLLGVDDTAAALPPGTILLADDLLPSELMALAPHGLAGLCIARGGPTSHVAILAAAMGVPALVAIGAALDTVADGTPLILDASGGLLHIAPAPDRLQDAERTIAAAATRRAAALARAGEACRTRDGTRIEVFANLGSRADAEQAVANGAEGCGLLRTEFLFLERDTAPSVAEQTKDYREIADALDGRPLIVRLLDIGGDKPAPYLPIPAEENPALGLRGIRVGLAHPAILEDQLRAILSVRPAGQCRIMLPMIASLGELRAVRAVLERLRAEMGITDPVELGVMVETPAAAVTADLLAREADFLSIGTNDLTQYALAMDRGNASVASALDGLHPAVLRLIAETCRGATAGGRWTGVCGGLASDPLAVPILIGLGVTELSATPAMVPEIKAVVATLSLSVARAHASVALACTSAAEVRALARTFAATELAA
jgi:phosphoenolpyruvate-protein phosphotransferase